MTNRRQPLLATVQPNDNVGVESPPPEVLDPGYVLRRGGYPPTTFTKTYRQYYRVKDSSLDVYEMYVGEDTVPDFDASDQPVASGSLPLSYSPPLPGSGDTTQLNVVVRKRNAYDLLSFNQHPTIVEIDSLGEEVLGPISDPEILNVLDEEEGAITVLARYPQGIDRNEADVWDVYVKLGSDPVVGVDSPVASQVFGKPGVDYRLHQVVESLTPGSTYHVMVVTRRSSESGDGEYGESAVVQHVVAQTYDMDDTTTDILI